ncbi:hypothetical protein [Marinimicrobium alkaliphilum]|uniref:hypothetical protein n=1 Tax=Marinimicrobium alkaliphilum TaxID=2202654 RepID=UPI000DBA645F|nr:hypothetical protein [Marinimicrobium alkaliphilum]
MAKPITIVLALTLLAACGSGGTGPAQPDPDPDPGLDPDPDESVEPITIDDLDVVRDFQPIAPAPQYIGPQTAATITQGNSLDLLDAFYTLLESGVESALAVGERFYPDLLRYEVPSLSDDDGPDCVSGRYQHTVYEEDQRRIIIGSYDDCELASGEILHGQKIIDFRFSLGGTAIVGADFTFRHLMLRDDGLEAVIHGQLHEDFGVVKFTDFTYKNVTQDFTAYADDLTIDVDNQHYSGYFYHSDWGQVRVQESVSIGGVHLFGMNSSELSARRRPTMQGSVLELTLTTAQGIEKKSELPILELFAWPNASDREPVAAVELPDVIEHYQTVNFKADYAGTSSRGFISYHWEHLSGPSGCAVELTAGGFNEQAFEADCRGTHELQLVADNGVEQYIHPFSVQTVGSLAQVTDISQQPTDTDEALSMQLIVDNADRDGPFTYRLVNEPPGLQIDDTGQISGTPQGLIRSGLNTFHFDVEISNERAMVQSVTADAISNASTVNAYDQGQFNSPEEEVWVDYHNDGHLQSVIDYGQTFAVLQAKDGEVAYRYIEARGFSKGNRLTRRVVDYDGDGQQDIVLVYPDRYLVIALDDFRVKHNIAFPDVLVETGAIQALVIGGNTPAILLGYYRRGGSGYSAMRYDIPSGSYTAAPYVWYGATTFSRIYYVADFTGDGNESIFHHAGNRSALNKSEFIQAAGEAVEFPGNVYVLDLAGDGIPDLVRPQLPRSADAERTLEVFDPLTGDVRDTLPIVGAPALSLSSSGVMTLDRGDSGQPYLVIVEHRALHFLERQGDGYQWLRQEDIVTSDNGNPATVMPFGEGKLALHTTGWNNGGLITIDSEGNREAMALEFEHHDQLMPFYVDTDSGELELIGFNATASETQNVITNRITLGENAQRVALESHLPFQGRPWAGRPALLAHEGGNRPRLMYEGLTHITLVDFETGEVVAERSRDDISHFYTGDLNGDGQESLFGLARQRFVQIDTTDLSFTPLGERVWPESAYQREDALLLDDVGSAAPSLLVPREGAIGEARLHVERYQDQGGQGLRATELVLTGLTRPVSYSRQDITGDGVAEVIVWSRSSGGDVIVLNANFDVIDRFALGSNVDQVLNMPNHRSNRLIFTHRWSVSAASIRIAEYDPVAGKIVSESQIFPGKLQRDGLICMGDDLYTCDKFLVFDRAVYHVQGFE